MKKIGHTIKKLYLRLDTLYYTIKWKNNSCIYPFYILANMKQNDITKSHFEIIT